MADANSAFKDYVWDRRDDVLYRAQLSALYHRDRERWFDRLDRCSRLLAMVSGSAALLDVVPDACRPYLLATVAISSALAVVFNFGEYARRHAELAAKWTLLEADIERAGETNLDPAMVDNWTARRAEIESVEPPPCECVARKAQRRLELARRPAPHTR